MIYNRGLKNILLDSYGEEYSYTPVSGGERKPNYPNRDDKKHHAERIEKKFQEAWDAYSLEKRKAKAIGVETGVYLQIKGKEGYDLITKSLEGVNQGVRLANVKSGEEEIATVYVPNDKKDFFLKKISKYKENAKNNNVINTIEDIQYAMVDSLWIGSSDSMPDEETKKWCEVWLRYTYNEEPLQVVQSFFNICRKLQISYKLEKIIFPERIVVAVHVNKNGLYQLLYNSDRISEFRKIAVPNSFFLTLDNENAKEWSDDLVKRLDFDEASGVSVCLIDTGVNNGHPLLDKVLIDKDMHTVHVSKGVHDNVGHGTLMAGIAEFFYLNDKLESLDTVKLYHFLESVKLLENKNDNPEELYGYFTSQAISLAEIENPNINRVICMAITADSDIEKDGRPSSWSGELDIITSDALKRRLMFVSAGNTFLSQMKETDDYYSAIINNSVNDPGQAWNVVTVGGYTNLIDFDNAKYEGYDVLASQGGISPFTSTSVTWNHSKWPIKPEIVLEAGNALYSEEDDFYTESEELSLISTNYEYHKHIFDVISMTSAATAQASCMAADLWKIYPQYWPETIRGLLIHSARWTEQMIRDVCPKGIKNKSDYRKLLRICGYGVPDFERACWSAQNSVNVIIQDELKPFKKNKSGSIVSNELHVHSLPWPKSLLQELENVKVVLRITLSYFIEPGPGEVGWKDKYRYQSVGLSFDVNNPTEDKKGFITRINKEMRDESYEIQKNDSSRWTLGVNNRNVGSIHSDYWETTAIELANSNLIAIFPKTGWWKTRTYLKKYDSKIRYALIMSIETPDVETALYNSIVNVINNKTTIQTMVNLDS